MDIQLYNTLTRRKEIFEPLDPDRVTMYVCGPTVYSYPHIGNARPAVVFDLLFRVLRARYPRVVYARNITDIDDKINAAAVERGLGIEAISEEFTAVYHQDMAALNVLPPVVEPRATEHVPEMLGMIAALIERGHAYEVEGHVLFDVASFEAYGTLSRRDRREMIAGARVEVAPYKKDPADFVLWKPSSSDQPGWDSPYGRGRPGWHLECSAMSEAHLGDTIDIHGGGQDLQFPHHENELAQSTCAHGGAVFAHYWMHNGFVNVDNSKMSKSLGNILTVRDLLEEAPGEAIRFALLSAHYRKPLDWDAETLPRAVRAMDGLYDAVEDEVDDDDHDDAVPEVVMRGLADDLNTPEAIAGLHALSREVHIATDAGARTRARRQLKRAGLALGLLQHTASEWRTLRVGPDLAAEDIDALIEQRIAARRERRFADADAIRDDLVARGVALRDHPDGTTTWHRA